MRPGLVLRLWLLALLPSCGGELHEAHFFVVNETTRAANDLHVTLSGTGGSLEGPVLHPDGQNCNPPAGVPTVAGSGNQVDVTWSTPCVQPQDTVGIRVKSRFGEVAPVSVVWTINGDTIR